MYTKKTTIGLIVAACLASSVGAACAADAGEGNAKAGKGANIGIVSGLAIGAAAGGPIGAFVGVATGALLGDHWDRQKKRAADLSADLNTSETERSRLTSSVSELDGSLKESRSHGAQLEQTVAAVDEVGMDLSFRTDDAAIRVEDLPPLLKLGALAAAMPEARVRVSGYADPRGPAGYNDALSERRAQAVAAALERSGLPPERMIVEAHGSTESTSTKGDLDSYALDRRVVVRLERSAPTTKVAQTVASAAPGPDVVRE